MSYKQYSAYGAANETVSKSQQIVMLYDGIIKFTRKARESIEENKIEERFNNLQRACKIILGLQFSLDFDNGGEISQILSNFYNAMDLRIMALNRSNSLEDLDKILNEIKIMRDAWNEIDQKNKTEKLEAPTSPTPDAEPSNFNA